ncbi:MAG: hypothetical protein FWH47_05465 [Methanomassiliicoccaceae archaeon]|nr:hypothetical protein [Methanomassiliicoccaceae archaeon]
MNKAEGAELKRIFFKYYDCKQIDDWNDKVMLDKLEVAGHTEYMFEDGKAYAQATVSGRRLHRPPQTEG